MIIYLSHSSYCRSKIEEESGEPLSDWAKLLIGISTKVSVHEHKDYGVICDLEQDPNLVGLAPLHQVCPLNEYLETLSSE